MSTTVTFDTAPEDEIETDADGVPMRPGWYLDRDGSPCYVDRLGLGESVLYVDIGDGAGSCGYMRVAGNGPYRRCPPFTLRWNGNYHD